MLVSQTQSVSQFRLTWPSWRCPRPPLLLLPGLLLQEGVFDRPGGAQEAAAAAAAASGGGPLVMGAVLIFLPGWDEIVRLKDKLEANAAFGGSR